MWNTATRPRADRGRPPARPSAQTAARWGEIVGAPVVSLTAWPHVHIGDAVVRFVAGTVESLTSVTLIGPQAMSFIVIGGVTFAVESHSAHR